MFGVLIALFCGLAPVRLWWRPYYFGPRAYGRSGCGGYRDGPHSGWHARERSWSRHVMDDVDATPSQERVMQDATNDVVLATRRHQRMPGLADAVADALAADTFDRAALSDRLSRGQGDTFRDEVLPAIERLHASLDAAQRRTLAARLRGSPWSTWLGH